MGFYDEAIGAAQVIIQEFGRQFKLVTTSAPVIPDATKPWDVTPGAATIVPLWGVFSEYDRKMIDNTTVKRTDKKLIFVSNPLITWNVSTKDTVQELSGEAYIVHDVKITAPGPIVAVYELQLRKG